MSYVRRLAVAAGMIVFIWLGIAIGVRLAYADRILPGTRMGGLSLRGETSAETRKLLISAFATRRGVTLTGAGRRFSVDPDQAGYRIDVPQSVSRARRAGREGPLGGLGSTVTGVFAARELEPAARLDRRRLQMLIASIAAAVDRPASPGALVPDADAGASALLVRALKPRAGRTLDQPATVALLLAALHDRRRGPLALPIRIEPAATLEEAQVVARRANDYLRTPLLLTVGTQVLTLTPRQTAGILGIERGTRSDTGARQPRLGVDAGRLAELVTDVARKFDRGPSSARIRAPGRPTTGVDTQGDLRWRPRRADIAVTPATSGRRLKRSGAVQAIGDAVRRGSHAVELPVTRTPPRVSTAAARRVTSLLGTFTTRYPCCQPRTTNIRLIAKAVDGTIVAPGERFSLNRVAGERTRSDGYVEAPFIADGRIVPSVGGGVSQFSTTIYNAAFFAGLRLDSHQPHSFYIDRYPPGREATLNFPDIDLAWTNDTGAPVLVRTASDATSVSVSIYGADDGRRVRSQTGERMPSAGGDFSITVTRILRYRGGRVVRQPFTTRYERPPPPE